MSPPAPSDTQRAALSEGRSAEAIHRRVRQLLEEAQPRRGVLVDVGCGGGALAAHVQALCTEYVGCDLVQYPGFPVGPGRRFVAANLNQPPVPLPDACADMVVSVETIEHLENPRAFVRELARLARPGAPVVVTTPNQLSLLSKATLLLRNEFNAFQERAGLYPAHITALLETDLAHVAQEAGLTDVAIAYSDDGRIPGTRLHWPARLGLRGRPFSDNVLLRARKPRT